MQVRHQRTNWYHPFLWHHISSAARKANFSAFFIVKLLQRDHPELFKRLYPGTVQNWLSKHGKRWSTKTLQNVERRHALSGSGRVGILSPHPELVSEIKEKLVAIRKSGIAIGRLLARSVMLAIIKERNPELLEKFQCSEVSLLPLDEMRTIHTPPDSGLSGLSLQVRSTGQFVRVHGQQHISHQMQLSSAKGLSCDMSMLSTCTTSLPSWSSTVISRESLS